LELEEVPVSVVGGLDIHRKQLTLGYLGTSAGEVKRGQVAPAGRVRLRWWLARFAGRDDVAFALEGCVGWRYVAEELPAAGITARVAEPADTAFARGRKRHAKTGKTDSRHLRELLAEGRLPECWIPPSRILDCRALLETCHDLRAEHTAWVQRVHAVFFRQGARPWPMARCAVAVVISGHCARPPRAACPRPGSCRWLSRWRCSPPWKPAWVNCGTSCWTPPGTWPAPGSWPRGCTASARSPRWP
jgi:hypothetical protein